VKTAKPCSSPKLEIVVSFVVTEPYHAPQCKAEKKAAVKAPSDIFLGDDGKRASSAQELFL
jgi:hypothetical protein